MSPAKADKIVPFKGDDDRWYWHATSDGEIVATGGQGFSDKDEAIQDAQKAEKVMKDAKIVDHRPK